MQSASIIEMVAERVCSCLWLNIVVRIGRRVGWLGRFEELAELILQIFESCKNGEKGKGY